MSLNDLMNDDSLLLIMGVIFILVMIVAIPMGISMSKKTGKQIYGEDESCEIKEEIAKILVRRSNPHPLNQSVRVNTVVFETSDGNRIELAIKDINTYNIMIEGDEGMLRYQGKRFIEFRRQK